MREADTQQEIGRGRVRRYAGRFPHEFACRAVQTALPLSVLRHSEAEQDYPVADRRRGALQPA